MKFTPGSLKCVNFFRVIKSGNVRRKFLCQIYRYINLKFLILFTVKSEICGIFDNFFLKVLKSLKGELKIIDKLRKKFWKFWEANLDWYFTSYPVLNYNSFKVTNFLVNFSQNFCKFSPNFQKIFIRIYLKFSLHCHKLFPNSFLYFQNFIKFTL